MPNKMRISFTLDESDIAYFKSIYRAAKKNASPDDWTKISRGVRKLIKEVRETKKVPAFVTDAIVSLEDLIEMVDDMDYNAPKSVVGRAVAALAYFANPQDVIPDDVPMVGFLDDAIMIKFVEEDLKHELWAYRKFRAYREGREQRFWTPTARERLRPWLEAKRSELRKTVKQREAKDKARAQG